MKKVLSVILVVAIVLLVIPSMGTVSGHYSAIRAIEDQIEKYDRGQGYAEWVDFGNSYVKEMFTDAITIFLEASIPGDEMKSNSNYRWFVSWFWKEFAAIGAEHTDSEVLMFVVCGDERIYLASEFGILDVVAHEMYDHIKD